MNKLSIRLRLYQLVWTLFFALLLGATFPLWTQSSDFPAVPLVGWLDLGTFSAALSSVLFAVLSLGLLLQWSKRQSVQQIGLGVVAFSLLLNFGIDQHRIQAWAYQFFFIAILLSVDRGLKSSVALTEKRLRWLVVSVYVYSCISKLDASFLTTLGPQMVASLLRSIGVDIANSPKWIVTGLVLCLPLAEGVIGFGLLSARMQRLFITLAVSMHLTLIVIVGPWGWHHQWGVVLWNLFFIFQVVILFWPLKESNENKTETSNSVESQSASMAQLLAGGATSFVLLFPLLTLLNVGDHWPGWELYSPRTSRAEVLVSANEIAALPVTISAHLEPVDSEGWCRLDMAQWSLSTQFAPIYPEDRFQLGVALGLHRYLRNDRAIRVYWRDTADRWSGERETKVLSGFDELERFIREFRLNGIPTTIK